MRSPKRAGDPGWLATRVSQPEEILVRAPTFPTFVREAIRSIRDLKTSVIFPRA
jgi:hypothetical protein